MKLLSKILTVFISLIMIFVACERKPLYLTGECRLNINVTTQISIDEYWNTNWRDSLIYNWDESKYGPIGYTKPDYVDVVLFNEGNIVKEQNIEVNKRQLIDVDLDKTYDFLIYNKTLEIESEYIGGRYYIYTPSVQSKANLLDDKYETVFCPGEVFSAYKPNVFLSSDIQFYDEVYDNGKLIYVYNIDATIHPVSWIYIIQFIIVNDDHSPIIEAKDITDFTVSGISDRKNLFTEEPKYTGFKQISTFDVKDGQQIVDSLVFAARFTILDLVPEDSDSSWGSFQNYLYYSGIDISTHSYGSVSGIVDITKQLNENPRGGIITVRILNSDIKASGQSSGDGGFGIDINKWRQQVIDIPF